MKLERVLDIIVPFGPFLRNVGKEYNSKDLVHLLLHIVPFTFFVYWLFSFIPFVGGIIYILILVPLSAQRHIKLKEISNRQEKNKIYLWYLTVVSIGFGSVWSFIGHTFLANTIAENIGWATGSPFQTELAFYTLGSGVAGLMTIWLRGHMITATVITKSIFWYGAAFVHIQDAFVNKNYSPLNIGAPLIGDILLPTVFLTLLYLSLKNVSKTQTY